MIFRRRGWLGLGLGVSVALHAVAVLWLGRAPESAPAPRPAGSQGTELIEFQVATIAGRERPSRLLPSRAPVAAPLRVPPPGPEVSPPAQAPLAAGVGAPSGAEVEAPPAAVADHRPTGEAGDPLLPSPAAGDRGGAAAPGPSPVVAGGGGGSAGSGVPASTELLMARLSAAALRCYPAEAVRFRLSGEARLSFCLSGEGRANRVALAHSSGSDVLDRAASECVLPGALPLPGAAGCYELPVRFAARAR